MVIPGGGAVMTFAGAPVCASAGATKLAAATKAAAANETLFILTSVVTATCAAQPWEANTALRLFVARSRNFDADCHHHARRAEAGAANGPDRTALVPRALPPACRAAEWCSTARSGVQDERRPSTIPIKLTPVDLCACWSLM